MKNVLEVPVAGLAIFLEVDVKFYIVLVIMIILVMLSAFFSMSETAFSSANDVKLRVAIEDRKHGAKKALQLYDSFDRTLITLLIGNNLVNVALSTLNEISANSSPTVNFPSTSEKFAFFLAFFIYQN